MVRVVVPLVLLVAACGDPATEKPDARIVDAPGIDAHVVMRTPPFTMLICASGVPGDSTCPINVVQLDALGAAATGARLSFVLLPIDQDFYLDDIHIEGSTRLHMRDVFFEKTTGSAGSALLFIEDVDARTTLGPLPLNEFTASQFTIRVEVLYQRAE